MDYLTGVQPKETLEISELLSQAESGATVKVNGAVHTIRDMGTVAFEARCQLLKEQYEQLDEQKKQIENTMERLQYKISKYENAIKTGELTWDK